MNGPRLPVPTFDDVRARVADWTDDGPSADVLRRVTPSLDRLRADAALRVELSSVASVARSVGMRRASLRRFLDGGPIRASSRGKLFRFLVRTAAEGDERASTCAQMLLTLVLELPPEEQISAVYGLVEKLREEFEQRTGSVPLWLRLLVETVAPFAPDNSPDPVPPRSSFGSGH